MAWRRSDPVYVGQDPVEKYAGECAAAAAPPGGEQQAASNELRGDSIHLPEQGHRTDMPVGSPPPAPAPPSVTLLGNIGKEKLGGAMKQPSAQKEKGESERRSKEKGRNSISSAVSASSSSATSCRDLSNLEGEPDGEAEEDDEIIMDGVFSEGSKLHAKGQCKPCAFFHTTGCQTGEACKFCHLCPPREVQRRKQIRRRIQREILHRTEAALLKASGGAQQHQAAHQQQQQRGGAGAMLGAAWAQARYNPVMNAFGAISMTPFVPMATPVLQAYLGGGFPGGGYLQQPEALAGAGGGGGGSFKEPSP